MIPLFKLLSLMPLWLLHGIGWILGWVVFLCSATYRRRFLANAALAGYDFASVRGAVASAGSMTTELPRLWMGRPVTCEWDNDACVDRAYAAGRGIVFLTPHMGCFEVSAQTVGQRYRERYGPLTVLYRPARQPWLARLMAGVRASRWLCRWRVVLVSS